MRRTAKYATRPLNRGKRGLLRGLIDAFACLKDLALRRLARTGAWDFLDGTWHDFRDEMKAHYRKGVPVHLLDQAVKDAVETTRKWIDAAIASAHIRQRIFVRFAGEQRHYAFWLLTSYARLGAVLRGEAPVPSFDVPLKERKETVRFLRRLLRRALGKAPRVRLRRSMALDSSLYRVFEHQGHLYLSLASLRAGERLVLPLRGRGRISGDIRVVFDAGRRAAFVHMAYKVPVAAQPATGAAVGLDAGVTEVLAASSGEKYGQGYGGLLDRLTRRTTETGRARNKLYQIAQRAEERGDAAKASRIRRQNLGRRKLQVQRRRGEAAVQTMVGQAVRTALKDRPSVVAVEDLSHLRGRTRSRKLSRIVSRWARSALRERLEFRAAAGGSRLRTVNAAYTSQTCASPACGFVHKENRHGDRFHCLQCGRDGDADVVAGMNLLARVDDPDIHLWTPKERVKAILQARFRRRKETGTQDSTATVSSVASGQGRACMAAPAWEPRAMCPETVVLPMTETVHRSRPGSTEAAGGHRPKTTPCGPAPGCATSDAAQGHPGGGSANNKRRTCMSRNL